MKFRLFVAIAVVLTAFTACDGSNSETSGAPSGAGQEPLVIYEVNPRLFQKGAAFDGIADRIDEIKALGVDVLWIMPMNEPGVLKSVNSPYCIKDFKKVNPDYGTVEDLKDLVNKAHSKGMKVIVDWIANHSSWDCAWIANKDWYTQDADGNIIDPPGFNWTDVADLNFGNPELRAAMDDAILYWVKEVGIDGYRFDHVDGVPLDYWESINKKLKEVNPDAILLAETGKTEVTKAGFTSVYSWNFGNRVKQVFNGTAEPSALMEMYNSEKEIVAEGARIMRYITNHDESSNKSPVTEFKSKEAALAGFVVTSLMTDMPLIYSSQEIGYANRLNFFNFIKMDWNADPAYTKAYKDYMKLYKESASLRGGDPALIGDKNGITISYAGSGNKSFMAVINTNNRAVSVAVPVNKIGSSAKNLATGDKSKLGSSIKLQPYEYLFFEVK